MQLLCRLGPSITVLTHTRTVGSGRGGIGPAQASFAIRHHSVAGVLDA